MLVIDTSALMAVLLGEPDSGRVMDTLERETDLLISAATLTEALIVAERRGIRTAMEQLVDGLGCQIVPLSAQMAKRAADAHQPWGKGRHPAGLNLGDCFAYVLAQENEGRLLYVGNDFARTDLAVI